MASEKQPVKVVITDIPAKTGPPNMAIWVYAPPRRRTALARKMLGMAPIQVMVAAIRNARGTDRPVIAMAEGIRDMIPAPMI